MHIYGQAKTFRDTDRIKQVVDSLTSEYEAVLEQPWQPDYKSSMLGAIVGVDIAISDIECKYKLSQNRPTEDQLRVIAELKNVGADDLAAAMTDWTS